MQKKKKKTYTIEITQNECKVSSLHLIQDFILCICGVWFASNVKYAFLQSLILAHLHFVNILYTRGIRLRIVGEPMLHASTFFALPQS